VSIQHSLAAAAFAGGRVLARAPPAEAQGMKHLVFGLVMVLVYFVFPGCVGMG
jgi:hypothetical protein